MAEPPAPLDGVSFVSGGPEMLDRVGPLWLQLRGHHADHFPPWGPQLLSMTFESRRAGLLGKAAGGGDLLVLMAVAGDADVAYCVSTVSGDRWGEVDSLYVEPGHRRRGIGRALVARSMDWLAGRGAKPVVVDVLSGNDEAMRLYESFGFRPRTVRLCHVP